MSNAAKCFNSPNDYFVCTLGEAAELLLNDSNIQTVNDFIDHQDMKYPKENAAGFPIPTAPEWSYELFSFEDLRNGSLAVANQMLPLVLQSIDTSNQRCVALLCPSSTDFLFAWLGIMRAGFSVLLIAPQCQPAAIAHLCKSCHVSVLFYDASLANLALKAVSEDQLCLAALRLPWQSQNIPINSLIKSSEENSDLKSSEQGKSLDTAFIFHTSGTSTGLPKPITQSHRAAIGVLPVLDGRKSASFTTTPLYHGGIADCLRAWTSRALIWLFPASTVPITAYNISLCLSVAERVCSQPSVAEVKLLSCVPYVLQMLSEEPFGLKILQKMSIVGVGGAALGPGIGNYLVENGVNLVSRFGSAECGFLLSSHRDFATDKEWQYLRLSSQSNCLEFEQQADSELSELVVRTGWPHIAKTNREDGSFATGDLFEAHDSIRGAWKYHSRSDSQITLNTGKKFDPAPLEDLIALSSPLIREVMVFGSHRQSPGVLILPSEEGLNLMESTLEEEIWKTIKTINSKGDNHTRIARDKMVVVYAPQVAFERSSKGTLLRGVNEKAFMDEINSAYSQEPFYKDEFPQEPKHDADVKDLVRSTVREVLGTDDVLSDDTDFYTYGVDSAMCTRIRSLLELRLRCGDDRLPWNVVYDCGNVERLSNLMIQLRSGKPNTSTSAETEMLQIVEKFSGLISENQDVERHSTEAPYVVLLTGATGALGAHILDLLRKSSLISQIICLVRAPDHFTARARVSASLLKRKKPSLQILDPKIQCSPYKLNELNLGISAKELTHIQQEVTHVIHAAWAVNFCLPLRSFVEEHVVGIYHLLNLTLSCSKAVPFNFCSSTASVLNSRKAPSAAEEISTDPLDAGSIGYSRSKWVAEAICAAAAKHLPGRVNILRLGQLTGDTENGVWNMAEAWPLMLSTVDALGCLPRIEEPLSWLPLDTAAEAIVEVSLKQGTGNKQPHLYHIVNNSTEATWSDLLVWSREARLMPFDVVSPTIWMDKLERFPQDLPAKNILGLWRNAHGKDDREKEIGRRSDKAVFSIEKAQKDIRAMQSVPSVDQELVTKIWSWLDEEIKAAK